MRSTYINHTGPGVTKRIAMLFAVLLFPAALRAQDYHLSMYESAPLFLNPAMTGIFDGKFRFHGQQRSQWRTVNFKPYQTSLISMDMPKGRWGFGGQIVNMRAGYGNFNSLEATGSAAMYLPVDKSKNNIISLGTQLGIKQKTVEQNLLTFDNQYTTSNGGYFDRTLPSGENFSRQNLYLPQLNFGALFYNANQQKFINPFAGYSVFNLTRPKESFYKDLNRLPVRHYFSGGLRLNITELFYVIPKALVMLQKNAAEQTFGADVGYYLRDGQMYLLGGLLYRNRDAGVIQIGAKKENYVFKIGYDVNTSSLNKVSKARGAIEVSFTYIYKTEKTTKVRVCPRLQ